MNTDNNECDNTVDSTVPYEDWSKENLIRQVKTNKKEIEDYEERIAAAKCNYEERIKASVSLGSELSDRLEKIKSRTFDEWLRGWVDDRVTERVKDEMEDLDLEADDISGLTDLVHESAEESAKEHISELSASDIYGLDDLIREQAEEVFDNKIEDVSIDIEARIVS